MQLFETTIPLKLKTASRTMLLLTLFITLTAAPATADTYSESTVKAAYLYRFTGYIDWPPSTQPSSQFTIAVLNDDDVAAELTQLLKSRTVKNLPTKVHKIRALRELDDAQMLYVGSGETDSLQKYLSRITTHPIVIVTNNPEGLATGSTINFITVDSRVRFEASLIAAERAGLKIAPELLAVAVRVQSNRAPVDSDCAADVMTGNASSRCRKAAVTP